MKIMKLYKRLLLRYVEMSFKILELDFQYIVEISCMYFYFSEHQRLLKMKERTISVRISPRKFVIIMKFGTYCEMLPT